MDIRTLKTEVDYESALAEFGDSKVVAEVLRRNRKLTLTLIRRLNQGLWISANILIQPHERAAPSSRSASMR